MGLVQSHLNKKKDKAIEEIDTLNKSIEFLGHHKKMCGLDIDNRIKRKEKLDNEIVKCKHEYGKYVSLDCKICFDSLIETILVPCGHCYCNNCSNNMDTCYICQQQIVSKYKIYKN